MELQERLAGYLSGKLGSDVRVTSFARKSGGASRETYLFDATWHEAGRTVERGYVLRRDPVASVLESDRTRAIHVPPRVVIDNHASNTHTVLEVNGRDRLMSMGPYIVDEGRRLATRLKNDETIWAFSNMTIDAQPVSRERTAKTQVAARIMAAPGGQRTPLAPRSSSSSTAYSRTLPCDRKDGKARRCRSPRTSSWRYPRRGPSRTTRRGHGKSQQARKIKGQGIGQTRRRYPTRSDTN
jgi:hypothetical protein